MPYAFPTDLADQVLARWTTFVARHDRPAPPLPSVEQLRYILETAFQASFAREEGRSLRFVLCCAPGLDVPRDGVGESVPLIPFRHPRALTVDAIRSLAPAASPTNSAILVRFSESNSAASACELSGVLNVGSNLAHARRGRSIYNRPIPYALVIDVRDAGELHVHRGSIELATLKNGQLQDQLAFSEIEFLPMSGILTQGIDVMRTRIQPPEREAPRETSDFEWTALLNTILSIVNGLELHGHGGTLLVAASGSEHTLPIRKKFDVDADNRMLTDRFVAFVNARHALVSARGPGGSRGTSLAEENGMAHLRDAALIAEEDLANATDLIARLSAVDGALVLSSDLRVLGFGAEIVLDTAKPVAAFEVSGHLPRGKWPEIDSESFGMRHRSALRCIAVAEETAAFVVSQDGSASFFWKQGGRVLIKRGLLIANANMTGG